MNVARDGGDQTPIPNHAFLIDTKTRPTYQRQGLGVLVVRRAIAEARAAGREWLFVDFEAELTAFYIEACGFSSTPAGLVHLPAWASPEDPSSRPPFAEPSQLSTTPMSPQSS